MKIAGIGGVALLVVAGPAFATSGYSCTTEGDAPISVDIVIGHAAGPAIAQVRLTENGRTLSTADADPQLMIAQSWIDDKEVRIDLVDANAERYEARLRVRNSKGTLERGGKTYRVVCDDDQ